MKNPRKHHPRSLQYENLESRQLMAVTTLLNGGVLNVYGSAAVETIAFRQTNNVITIAGMKDSWSASQITTIMIDLKGGADSVSLDSIANGGKQALTENITIKSGVGTETMNLANGKTVTMTGTGHTLAVSTAGVYKLDNQVLSWNTPAPPPPPPPAPPSVNNNWFDSNVIDAALRTLGHNLYNDGRIDRNDMIALLQNAEDGNTVDATEFADLRKIVTNSTLFGSLEYVGKLASYIVSGSTANAKVQGQAVGNLAAGSTGDKLEKLIGKWFLGVDHPTANGTYREVSGTLFVNGAAYTDIKQGYLGDCYFMAGLAETALKTPSAITSMFTVNGDGTYTVRFYNNGRAEYVTVDSYLPTDSAGRLIYANLGAMYNNTGNELWTALAEKAYVQINEVGWLRGSNQNNYAAIEGGYIYAALGQITGRSTTAFASTTSAGSFSTFVNAFNQGKSIGFASKSSAPSVVSNHAYAVVGYNASSQTVVLYNPWGTQYGLVTMTWSQIQANFSYFDRTV